MHQRLCKCPGCGGLTDETADQLIAKLGALVRDVRGEHGEPGFAYTEGLTETYGMPELIMVGDLGMNGTIGSFVGSVLLDLLIMLKEGKLKPSDFEQREVPNAIQYAGACGKPRLGRVGCVELSPINLTMDCEYPLGFVHRRYPDGNFRAKQIFMECPNGRLPWETGGDQEWLADVAWPMLGAICNVPECKANEHIKTCSRCRRVKYCSAEHQKLDWPQHKKSCK